MRSCECGRPVFGTDKNTNIGYCQSCQWKRTDKAKKKIAVRSQKQPSFDLSFGFESQVQLFEYLWKNAKNKDGKVICPFTKRDITFLEHQTSTGEWQWTMEINYWLSCFAHILPKGKYTYWKLNPDNICVVNPIFHQIIDQGTTEERAKHPDWKWDLWDKKVLEMKQKYLEFKKQNLLS